MKLPIAITKSLRSGFFGSLDATFRPTNGTSFLHQVPLPLPVLSISCPRFERSPSPERVHEKVSKRERREKEEREREMMMMRRYLIEK